MTEGANQAAEEKIIRTYQVRLSQDRLGAFIIPGPGEEPPQVEALRGLLEEAGVVHGVSQEALSKALMGEKGEQCQVAWGDPPEHGEDGRIQHLVSVETRDGPTVLEDGRVDYLTRDSIINVRQGQELLRVIPPTQGTPGKGVDGQELKPRPGKPARILAGRGTGRSPDGSLVLADTSGEMVITPSGQISVVPVHRVPKDVDISTGHVDFVGSLEIGGSVRDGLTARADGDIRVGSGVEAATVEATGNVVVKGGVKGRGRAVIRSGGNVQLRFMENAHVEAEGDVLVGEAVMHSTIRAGQNVVVSGKRGLIVGGHISAGRSISGKLAGAGLGTKTILEIAAPPEMQEEHTVLLREKDEITASLQKVKEGLKRLKLSGQTPGQEMVDKLLEVRQSLEERLEEIRHRLGYLEEVLSRVKAGRVKISGAANSGVRVIIAGAQYIVRETLTAPKFGLDSQGEVRVLGYGEGD